MATLTITGYSDDNIEIDGAIREEIGFYPESENNACILAVSDGTVLKVVYDSYGIWRVTRLIEGAATMTKVEGDVDKDTFDVVTLTHDAFKWVVVGDQVITPKE